METNFEEEDTLFKQFKYIKLNKPTNFRNLGCLR